MRDYLSKLREYLTAPSHHPVSTLKDTKEPICNSKYLALSASLRGNKIHVRDVGPMFDGWITDQVNTCYSALKLIVNTRIARFGFEGQKLDKLRRVDFALFVSVWWPRASYETCVTIVYLCIWLFVWDDEIDLEENVTGTDFGAAQTFRRQTLEVVEYNLGFGDQAKKEPISPNAIIGGFREVGRRLRSSYNERQIRRLFDELSFYMNMTQLEQEAKFSDTFPALKDYWDMRLGSSGCKPLFAMAELAIDSELPAHLRESPEMATLWKEGTISISMSNDIMSLKKELLSNGIISQIPLAMVNTGVTLQQAVDDAMDELERSIGRFETSAKRIGLRTVDGTQDRKDITAYVDVLKTNITGNHYWSIRSGRYLLAGTVREDGSVDIEL